MKKFFTLSLLVMCSLLMSAKVIYYTGSLATPYIHYWGGTSTTTWPGDAMTLVDGTTDVWQSADLDCSSCIFSNNGANQTADLGIPGGKNYYNNGTWDVYGVAPTVTYYVTGNDALWAATTDAQGAAWNPAGILMTDGSYTFTNMPAAEYKLKVTMGNWTGAMGFTDLTAESSAGIYGDGDNNICFEVTTPNDVTVSVADGHVTVTGSFKNATVLPEVDLKGINGDWTGVHMVNNADSLGCSYTYTLTAGTYEFKVYKMGKWLGNNGTMTRTNCTAWSMEENTANCHLAADVDGDYVFTYNYEDGKMSVKFPAVYALNPYAYGVSAAQADNELTVSYSLQVAAEAVAVEIVGEDETVLATAVGETAKGAHTATLDITGLAAGDYTVRVAATGKAHDFTTYADSTKTFTNRYHATVDANPMSPNFGMIYGASRGSDIGIYVINPDYSYINTTPNMMGQSSWSSVQRGAVAPNGEMWFSSWGDANSGIYRYDHSTNPNTVTQFFQGTRNGDGLFVNNGAEVGCSTPGIAIYADGENSKLYAMSEDFTGGNNQMAVYNIGQADGTIVTSWGEAPSALFKTTDNAGTNFALCATPYGVWSCQHRAYGSNAAGARSLQFHTPNGVQKYLSTDPNLINGSMGAGIVMNATYDKLWMVDGRGDLMQFAVAWSADSVPTLTKEATYTTPFGSIAQMTFDFAGNIVAVGGTGTTAYSNNAATLRLAVFSLPTEAPVAVTPKAVTIAQVATAIDNVEDVKVVKFFQNGQVFIQKGDAVYNVMGVRVK